MPNLARPAAKQVRSLGLSESTTETITMLASDLIAYQDDSYAHGYLAFLQLAREAERKSNPDDEHLTLAVARSLHKLMAYKDEYEVARLLTEPDATASDVAGGQAVRTRWAKPMMKLLAKGKRLRGTKFDPFARAEVRNVERRLIADYRSTMATLVGRLTPDNIGAITLAARLPMEVRGYEGLKLQRAAECQAALAEALEHTEG